MKITITENIKREIELIFPASFKNKSGTRFYYFKDEKNGLSVWPSLGTINTVCADMPDYTDLIPCEKSEVEAAFNQVVKLIRQNFKEPVAELDAKFKAIPELG